MDPSPAVADAIRLHIQKLDRFADHIVSSRVTVTAPHKHQAKGRLYHAVVDIRLPGGELVVSRQSDEHHAHEDIYVALRDAFNAARRQLQDYVRIQRGKVKAHKTPPHGRIGTLTAFRRTAWTSTTSWIGLRSAYG